MKLRHLILFLIACAILILSDLSGGSLLALMTWLQIYNLFLQKEFNRKTQVWAFLISLCALPLLFFWGSIHSFLFVYLNERNLALAILTLFIDYGLCLMATIYFIFAFDLAQTANFEAIISLKLAIDSIKMKKTAFFKISCLFLVFSLIPFFAADWKIVFSVMATQLFLHRNRLKPVFDSGL